MSWLSSAWSHNRDWLGNLAKNVSPFLALTPLGIPGAIAAGALGRGVQHGANLGNIIKSGASNGAIGAGVQGGMGALRSAFNPSSSAAAASYGGGAPAASSAVNSMPGYLGQAPINAAETAASQGGGGLASHIGSALGRVGSFAEAHPKTLEMGLSTLDPSQRDYRQAQTNALNSQTSLQQQEFEAMKRRQAQLQPLWDALAGQVQGRVNNPYPVAGNPYA